MVIILFIIIIFVFGLCLGAAAALDEYEPEEQVQEYEIYLECDKLFITNHYRTLKDYNIIDLSDFMKQGVIRVDCGHTRPTKPGETHGRTNLYGPAAVRKVKGEDKWEYVEL